MSSVGFFLPLILLILTVLVIRWFIQMVNRRFRLYMNVKRTTWLLVGYGATLLIAMGMSYVVSLANAAVLEIPYAELEKEYQAFYEAASRGNIEQIKKYSVMEKEWDFPYAEKEITIVMEDNEHYAGWLIVERKQVNDGLIKAALYRSRAVTSSQGVYTIDFSNKIPPFGIELSGETMTITKPTPVELNYAIFKKEFTINQFTGEGGIFNSATFWGQNVLYLQIPKDLEIEAPYVDIRYWDLK